MTMITPSAQLTLTKGNKSWVPGPPSSCRHVEFRPVDSPHHICHRRPYRLTLTATP